MATYLIGGKCLKGVEYYSQEEDHPSSFSSSSAGSSFLSDSFNQILYSEKQQQVGKEQLQVQVIFLRRQGLSSQDLSLRLEKGLQQQQEKSCLELDASRNQLTFLPSHLQLFTHLTQLVLSNNLISIIPPELYQNLGQLQTLLLSENQIEFIPQDMPHYLPYLRSLSLDGNQLEYLPDTIGYWKNLREFRLGSSYGGNQLKTLPATISSNMVNLVDLDVSFNQLHTLLPNTFLDLKNLSCLNLSHNQLTHLPPSLFGACPELTTIDLSDNQITFLSETVTTGLLGLQKLELLNLSDNQLHILPAELLDQSTIQVIIKGNPVTEFPVQQPQQQRDIYYQFVREMTQRAEPTQDYDTENTNNTNHSSHINQLMINHATQYSPHDLNEKEVNEIKFMDEENDDDKPFLLHSLREISLRTIILLLTPKLLSQIPDHIATDLGHERIQTCPSCYKPFVREWVSSVQIKSYRGHPSVACKVRFCSTTCWYNYRAKLIQRKRELQQRRLRDDSSQFIHRPPNTFVSGSIDWIIAAVSAASAQEEQADLLANVNA